MLGLGFDPPTRGRVGVRAVHKYIAQARHVLVLNDARFVRERCRWPLASRGVAVHNGCHFSGRRELLCSVRMQYDYTLRARWAGYEPYDKDRIRNTALSCVKAGITP